MIHIKNYTLVNFCEFDKYATKAYCAIHGVDESLNLGDITKVNEYNLADFNLMTWGFPCTDISLAGKQKGFLDENGNKTRSGLYEDGMRILKAKKPAISIIENVKNLTSKKFENEFQTVLNDLGEAGYNTYWKVLNAKNYGIPQNRERVFIVSVRKDLDNGKFVFPNSINSGVRLKHLLDDVVDEKYYIDVSKLKIIINDIKSDNDVIRVGKISSSQDGLVVDSEGIAPTHTAGHGNCPKVLIRQATKLGYIGCKYGGVADLSYPDSKTRRGRVQDGGDTCPTITATETGIHKIESQDRIRKLIPKETWRLMGFKDKDFDLAKECGTPDNQLYKQSGNSIVVNVLFYIYLELYKAMPFLFDDLKLSSFFSGIGAFENGLDMLYEYLDNNIQ